MVRSGGIAFAHLSIWKTFSDWIFSCLKELKAGIGCCGLVNPCLDMAWSSLWLMGFARRREIRRWSYPRSCKAWRAPAALMRPCRGLTLALAFRRARFQSLRNLFLNSSLMAPQTRLSGTGFHCWSPTVLGRSSSLNDFELVLFGFHVIRHDSKPHGSASATQYVEGLLFSDSFLKNTGLIIINSTAPTSSWSKSRPSTAPAAAATSSSITRPTWAPGSPWIWPRSRHKSLSSIS